MDAKASVQWEIKMDVVLVGCGNMGFAMLERWIAVRPKDLFHVVEPSDILRERAVHAGAKGYYAAERLPEGMMADLVILAVKPQVMGDVAPAYAGRGAAYVSIAAGVTLGALEGWLGGGAVVRTMPNTPAAVGQGMLVSVANDAVTDEARAQVDALMSATGEHAWVEDEALMDAVTAVSGSGPAYVFHFIEALGAAAVALGLPEDLAHKMALQTVAGAGALAAASEDEPGVLRRKVTSPKGTTEAALTVLMGPLGSLVGEAAEAARARSVELGKG